MKHTVAFCVDHREAVSAHQFLALLAENGGADRRALITQRSHADLGCRVLPTMTIEMALPETLNTIIIQAIIAGKRCWIVLALLASLLRLDDLAV